MVVGYNNNARSRIPCRRARKFILKRGKLNWLRHRKLRPCIGRCGVLFLSNDYPFPCINTGFVGTFCTGSPWSRGMLSLVKVDKRKCLFMPFIEKISVPYDMVIFVYDVFGKMGTGVEAL